ncbi:MAG TPA: transketolase [Gammaproteobacteria bacterium]|nr:transketolase [Gammaproteobacteria bacterium]
MSSRTPRRRELANAIRALSMDAVQKAASGHPGMPMGMADIAEVLWNDFHKHNPGNPRWHDRDRFILSNGHGSMLLYSLAWLTGYELPLEELKNFRQLGYRTAGHPEYEPEIGIETTTGPLGQGLANAVGMALAEKVLAVTFNRPGFELVDHHTWVFMGDGCLMEGISHEACSLAGTLALGKLIGFYDSNGISIDGRVEGWFTDDTAARFRAYRWHVIDDVDGHDAEAIREAIEAARAEKERPSLIVCRTIIGFGAPNKQGTEATHGSPLGEDEVAGARRALGWPHAPFEVPDDIRAGWDARERGAAAERRWNALYDAYRKEHPALAGEYARRMRRGLPDGWETQADRFIAAQAAAGKSEATRKSSEAALDGYGPLLPELIGGSADLTGSNNTYWSGSKAITAADARGNYVYFGVREFGMTAILNGLALHGGFIAYGATFLTFSDYARNAVRMAALIGAPSILVYTHDSIGLGEDGPTHQPIEHLASLRLMPNMTLWRPCDAVETAVAWRDAIERGSGPTSLVLTRQGLPHQPRTVSQVAAIRRGGYVLRDTDDLPELILIATGSEVGLAAQAAEILTGRGRAVRVVSMPSAETFAAQDAGYRDSVLPPQVTRRVAIEAGVSAYWCPWVGPHGRTIGIDRFGASAPAKDLFAHFGFTPEHVVEVAESMW